MSRAAVAALRFAGGSCFKPHATEIEGIIAVKS
jgi:hypothetical protein